MNAQATMTTLNENTKRVGSSCYYGQRGEWLIVLAVHRDSDVLSRSNFEVAKQALNEHSQCKEWSGEDSPVAIERFSHWAVGWCDYLLVNPEAKDLVALAEQMRQRIEDYPVLDESHYSEMETDEANGVWLNCYNVRDRINYVRKHRSQFNFCNLADMLNCIRGKYFAGYASELIN